MARSASVYSMVCLTGFTPKTLDYLSKRLDIESTDAVADGIPRADALHLAHELRATHDDTFPGGKWATIQHLETLIGDS